MRVVTGLLFIILFGESVYGYIADQNLFVISGRDAAFTEGDAHNRAVFYVEIPKSREGVIHIRVFDADCSGKHDRWEKGSEVLYRLYGKGNIDWKVRTIADPLPSAPLAELRLAENRYYDNQWRTIATPDVLEGEPRDDKVVFQLVVDGVKGAAKNKYQLFVSTLEKENKEVEGIRITAPLVNLYLPPAAEKATQIRFDIPKDTGFLEVYNFDADRIQYDVNINFETRFKKDTPITASKNGQESVTKVPIGPEESGGAGALVINNKNPNYIQLWVFDDRGRTVPLVLPVFIGLKNRLPVPDIRVTPLSDCFAVMLDASGSDDPDGDDMDYEWFFPGDLRSPGSRIVHDFGSAGDFDATLIVTDRSGFIACGSRLTRTIRINEPPKAAILAPETGIPNDLIVFDGSESSDSDGKILDYSWKLGDGARKSGARVKHRYPRPGKYRVELTVDDDSKSLCSRSKSAQWIRINASPVPRLSMQPIAGVEETVTLDAGESIDSDGEIVRWSWDFGDESAGEGKSVTHQWKNPGTYKVRLSVADNSGLGNSVSDEIGEIVINAPPVARVKVREVVSANEELLFDGSESSDPDGTLRQYVWNTGDGTTLDGARVRHSYEKPGVYEGSLAVTDDTETPNNKTSKNFAIRVNYPPVPSAGEGRVVNTSEVAFDAGASTDRDDPIIDYHWEFGDGKNAHGAVVRHVYSHPGKYLAKLTVTDGSGTLTASRSDETEVIVNHPPIADAGGNRLVSPNEKIVFDGGYSEDPDGRIVSFRWEMDNNATMVGESVEHSFENPGVYQVRLNVKDNRDAEDSDYATVTVNAPPVADFYPVRDIAPGQIADFDGSPSHDPDGSILRAWWIFGGNSREKEGLAVKHAFDNPGRYTVILAVQDDSKAANDQVSKTEIVHVNFPPLANAGRDIHTCDQVVRFDAGESTDPDGDTLIFGWDFGDGTTGRGIVAEHHYAAPGVFPVTLTVDDGKGLSNSISKAKIITHVDAPPEVVAGVNSQKVCAGEMVLFDAGKSFDPDKGPLRYIWDLGDGKEVEGVNPVRSYKIGGDYRIRLSVADDSGLPCGKSFAETVVQVVDAPIADAGENMTACANRPIRFDGSKSSGGGRHIKSYEWEFGDGQYGVGVNPTHVYSREGHYIARLLITVSGEGECENTAEDEMDVNVMAAPVAVFQSVKMACAGETVTFDAGKSKTAIGTITEYLWDFGDGTKDSGKTARHAYEKPGEYTVGLKIETDSGKSCTSAENSAIITVNSPPVPEIRVASAGDAFSTEETYAADAYTILRFSGANSGDADGHVSAYNWDFGDGKKKTGPYVSHHYEKPGEYLVNLRIADNSGSGCAETVGKLTIRVREPALWRVIGPETICAGLETEYSIEPEEEAEWSFDDGSAMTGTHLKKTFDMPGKYQIRAKIGETIIPPLDVTVFALPKIQLPQKIDIFPDDRLQIRPVYDKTYGTPPAFQWDTGDGKTLAAEKLDHAYANPGEYALKLLATGKGPECLKRVYTIPVTVHPPPNVAIRVEPEPVFVGGARDIAIFEAVPDNSENWNYAWDFGDGEKAIGQRVIHTFDKSGTYDVTVSLSDPLRRTSRVYNFKKRIKTVPRGK